MSEALSGAHTIERHIPFGAPPNGAIPAHYEGKNGSSKRILRLKDPASWARALLSEEFINDHLRTLHLWRGVFYRWDGSRYEQMDADAIKAIAWRFLETSFTKGKPGSSPNRFKPNRGAVADMIEALRAVCNLPSALVAPAWLDDIDRPKASEILVVRNGLLHLPSGRLFPPSPAFFSLNATELPFEPDALAPAAWIGFLDQIFQNEEGIDREAQEALQDWFGYCLLPDTSQQKIMLLVGPKRGGKGTIMKILREVVGASNVVAPTLDGLANGFGLEPLIGKTLAMIGDARLSGRADQAPIVESLLSISGEDTRTIARKFLPAWTGLLPTRFFISTNLVPRLADASGALASRFIVILLERSFIGQEDLDLKERLAAELPGILNWAREGYLRLRKRRFFVQPKSGREAIEDLETLGSPITAFVKDCCEVGSGFEVEIGAAFERWKTWCTEQNRREPGAKNQFGRDLKSAVLGVKTVQHREGGDRSRYYSGLRLRSAWE